MDIELRVTVKQSSPRGQEKQLLEAILQVN